MSDSSECEDAHNGISIDRVENTDPTSSSEEEDEGFVVYDREQYRQNAKDRIVKEVPPIPTHRLTVSEIFISETGNEGFVFLKANAVIQLNM